ncbi:uncharacterized protein [Aegilops tauschii subsp. strangulata]|uniref:uncharacterized protein n=1 Tax=Aegilops tauschii subsp. strangulata TaxID=200361 RepID=UPI00098B9577|nr:uncharacterized protein LOC109736946 [Aegilops tauschii subsp. strangulata]
MDGLVDACKVPCIYKSFGCERYVDQHLLAEHSPRCAHAPCYCYECTPLFEGSPASLVHHLTAPSVTHYWPAAMNIKYETCYPFAVPESLEDHCRLLVTEEDDSVFLLAVGTGKARAGCRPISVVCVRGNATDADIRPVYRCVLTVTAPPRYEGAHAASIMLTETVPSCSVPGNVDMEDAWYDFHPKMVHRDSKEVHLVICITKSNVHH